MSDFLNPDMTDIPADGGFLGGGYMDTPVEEYPAQGYAAQPEAQHYAAAPVDPYGSNSMTAPAIDMGPELTVQAPYLEEVQPNPAIAGGNRSDLSDLVLDVEVPVEVYFGDATLTVEEFLEMNNGSVIELEHTIDAPIQLRVRGRVVAEGQLVTINGNFGLRVTRMMEEKS